MFRVPIIRAGLAVDWEELLLLLQPVPMFVSFTYEDPVFAVDFADQPDQGTLDQVLAIVDGYQFGALRVRIHEYIEARGRDLLAPPKDFNFGLAPLHKVKTQIFQGDILEAIYYGAVNPQTGEHSIPVLKSTWQITYHALSVEVIQTLAWYRNDGSLHPDTKTIPIYYFGQRWLSWLEAKRSQIIDWLRWNVANAMLVTLIPKGWTPQQIFIEGAAFFGEYGSRIYSYVSGYDRAFPESVQSDPRPWLDEQWPGRSVTIREVFQEQLIYT